MHQWLFADDAITDSIQTKSDKQQMETLPIRDGRRTATTIYSNWDLLVHFRTSPGCGQETPIIALHGFDQECHICRVAPDVSRGRCGALRLVVRTVLTGTLTGQESSLFKTRCVCRQPQCSAIHRQAVPIVHGQALSQAGRSL